MPSRSNEYWGTFTQSELALLQKAYSRTCELLGRCPTTHEDKERLARTVIQIFEDSNLDPELTAERAAQTAQQFDRLDSHDI